MHILVLGSKGQVGQELIHLSKKKGIRITSKSREELDVLNFIDVINTIEILSPDIVINTTAYHNLNECENHFDIALAINGAAVQTMAVTCERMGIWFLTISTDYVFDGNSIEPYSEEATKNALQNYGISKITGELAVQAYAPKYGLIVRTCGIYGKAMSASKGRNFVENRLHDADNTDQLEVGSDLICTPTSALSFSKALLELLVHPLKEPGIYHLTAQGQCNWAQFTKKIFYYSGKATKIVPVDRCGNYGAIRRPAFSVLKNNKAAQLGIELPHWEDDLSQYIHDRQEL